MVTVSPRSAVKVSSPVVVSRLTPARPPGADSCRVSATGLRMMRFWISPVTGSARVFTTCTVCSAPVPTAISCPSMVKSDQSLNRKPRARRVTWATSSSSSRRSLVMFP